MEQLRLQFEAPIKPAKKRRGPRISFAEARRRIAAAHGDVVTMPDQEWLGVNYKHRFIDTEHGEWVTWYKDVANGHGHKARGYESNSAPRVSFEDAKKRIAVIHNGTVTMPEQDWSGVHCKYRFIDNDFGDWYAFFSNVVNGHCHPRRGAANREKTCIDRYGVSVATKSSEVKAKTRATCIEKYGVEHTMQSPEVRKKSVATCMKKYGVPVSSQNKEVAMKGARSQTNTTVKHHWLTGDELVCQASYEPKVVDYLNANEIDYLWQPKVFKMPDGKTYRPDMYVYNGNGTGTWVEIKGYFRKDAREKWDWFCGEHANAELWDTPALKQMGIL